MKGALFHTLTGRLVLAIIVLTALFYNLSRIPLFDEDEGAYAQVTLEMLKSGDLMVPRLGGEPFFHKPPLIYWTQALSVAFIGPTEFAFRLPSVLASMIWALLLFTFVRRRMDSETAGFTVFFLVSAMQINLVTRGALADAWLNLFITVTLFAIYAYFEKPDKRYILIAFAGAALGFMTKGPIAVLIPLAASLIFFVIQGRFFTWLKAVGHPLGWLVFLVIALPWYLILIHRFGWHFVEEIFMVHNLGRFRNAMEGHSGPLTYYIPVILLGLMPFTSVLIRTLGNLPKHLQSPWTRFLWIWFGFVFVFFSVADTKLQHYIIYGYVPLLILMALSLPQLKRPWLLALPPVLFLLPLLFLQAIARRAAPRIDDEFARIVLQSAMDSLGTPHQMVLGVILAGTLLIALIPRWTMQIRTLVLGCLFIFLTSGHLIPLAADIMQAPVRQAAIMAREKNYDVIMWQMNYPSFHVYYGKAARRKKVLTPGDIIITKADKIENPNEFETIFSQHGIILARYTPSMK